METIKNKKIIIAVLVVGVVVLYYVLSSSGNGGNANKVVLDEKFASRVEASDTTFNCSDITSIQIAGDRDVKKITVNVDDDSVRSQLFAELDKESGTFTWYPEITPEQPENQEKADQNKDELKNCKNADGKTFFELYKEAVPEN